MFLLIFFMNIIWAQNTITSLPEIRSIDAPSLQKAIEQMEQKPLQPSQAEYLASLYLKLQELEPQNKNQERLQSLMEIYPDLAFSFQIENPHPEKDSIKAEIQNWYDQLRKNPEWHNTQLFVDGTDYQKTIPKDTQHQWVLFSDSHELVIENGRWTDFLKFFAQAKKLDLPNEPEPKKPETEIKTDYLKWTGLFVLGVIAYGQLKDKKLVIHSLK